MLKQQIKKVWQTQIFCVGVWLLTLAGVAVVQTALNSSQHSFETNVFQQGRYDLTALLCGGESPLSRLLRNSRQRYSSQGRIVNTGNGSPPAALYCGAPCLHPCSAGTVGRPDIFICSLWINFFNSALPVRAGPFEA